MKNMKCIICNSDSVYYFSKIYSERPFDEFMREIGKINYYRCNCCGFVLSKTHMELPESKWSDLNRLFHHHIENPSNQNNINQPPYAEQAMMLSLLGRNGIIRTDRMIDYAAGYGTLSKLLKKYFNVDLPIFDPYIQTDNQSGYVYTPEIGYYSTVINSAMFEHILRRDDLENVNNLVDNDGCLIIHTVVCENVPNDSEWFYLRPPVHTAFHTNKSMNILMEQWGYYSSIYCPQSKCWVLLRKRFEYLEPEVEKLNQELKSKWFYCKSGFVDYWKGF